MGVERNLQGTRQRPVGDRASEPGDRDRLQLSARPGAGRERLNPTARAGTSSATGLYQFIDQSWLGVVKQHGAEHGLGWAADAITPDRRAAAEVVSDPADAARDPRPAQRSRRLPPRWPPRSPRTTRRRSRRLARPRRDRHRSLHGAFPRAGRRARRSSRRCRPIPACRRGDVSRRRARQPHRSSTRRRPAAQPGRDLSAASPPSSTRARPRSARPGSRRTRSTDPRDPAVCGRRFRTARPISRARRSQCSATRPSSPVGDSNDSARPGPRPRSPSSTTARAGTASPATSDQSSPPDARHRAAGVS